MTNLRLPHAMSDYGTGDGMDQTQVLFNCHELQDQGSLVSFGQDVFVQICCGVILLER